jgi:hypothetical protein
MAQTAPLRDKGKQIFKVGVNAQDDKTKSKFPKIFHLNLTVRLSQVAVLLGVEIDHD